MGSWITLGVTAVIVLLLAIVFGPRVVTDTTITFDPARIGPNPQAYIEATEADMAGLREGAAKEIVWADPDRREATPVSIVYIHGFSATKQELRPLPDRVAADLGANLFFTRLTGHGLDGEALADATTNDWINDYAEAITIGRMIGERVIVMATSTGASLATWAATQPELSNDVDAMVLISPNYGPQAPGAWILTLPWGGLIAELVTGRERSVTPINPAHGAYWTTSYPTRALLPMEATAELARRTPVADASMPALFVFSDADMVVQPDRTHATAEQWGGGSDSIMIEESEDPGHHVIAGDALSPSNTEALSLQIESWLRQRLQ